MPTLDTTSCSLLQLHRKSIHLRVCYYCFSSCMIFCDGDVKFNIFWEWLSNWPALSMAYTFLWQTQRPADTRIITGWNVLCIWRKRFLKRNKTANTYPSLFLKKSSPHFVLQVYASAQMSHHICSHDFFPAATRIQQTTWTEMPDATMVGGGSFLTISGPNHPKAHSYLWFWSINLPYVN